MKRMAPWRSVVEALEAEGIQRIYGLPGNPIHLLEDLDRYSDIKAVLVRHEHSGVALAYADARLSKSPAVCFGNPGPGITNMVTAALEATSGSLPVIILSNGVPVSTDGMGAFQELDSVALMRPVTKWATRIVDPATTPWAMQRAFSLAQNGRPGAVFLDLPSDIAVKKCLIPPYQKAMDRHRSRPDSDAVTKARDLLVEAKRPIIICGSGAVNAGSGSLVQELGQQIGAAFFSTPGGRGTYPENHPLCLGQIGLYFTQAGKRYFDTADLVISIGSRLEDFSTGGWTLWPKSAKLIQIDIAPDPIGLNLRPDVALVGDASLAVSDLNDAISSKSLKGVPGRLRDIEKRHDNYVQKVERAASKHETPISPKQVVHAINRVFGKDTIMVHENGGADLWSYYWPYYQVLDPDDCIPMAEQTAMGMGVMGAIAAKMVRPKKKVVCVTGDGALQMAMMELATAAEQRCGITWVVLNNQRLGWPQYIQRLEGLPNTATDFSRSPDFSAVATAQGCKGIKVVSPRRVDSALKTALKANRAGMPVLIDIHIAKHDYPPHFEKFHREVWGLGKK